MKAILNENVCIPKSLIDAEAIRKQLTIKVYDHIAETTSTVWSYHEDKKYIHVPRQYGLQYLKDHDIPYDDHTTLGLELPTYIKEIELRDYQEPFVKEIEDNFSNGEYDVVAVAFTGSGKTNCALEVARRLGRSVLVLVDQELIKQQWIDRVKEFWGVPDEDIGVVQGKECIYKGRLITVAMIQTVYNREYPDSFYENFGTVIVDEFHAVGAEKYSQVLAMFPATYRLGITATPNRGDDTQKLLDYNLGPAKVQLEKRHRKSVVRYVKYSGVLSQRSNTDKKASLYVNEIAADSARNHLLAKIVHILYTKNRDVLIVSDRIEQLEELYVLCKWLGVPVDDMGLATGFKSIWMYKEDTSTTRIEGVEKGAEYCRVSLKMVRKKVKKEHIEHVKNNSRLIFATYGMFSKAVDVPRLSAGIDCTPRSKAQQVHGRILRDVPGKERPIWVTIRDVNSYKAEGQFLRRLSEYRKSNAEIYEWQLELGTKKRNLVQLEDLVIQRVKDLRRLKIITGVDGRHTILTQSIRK